MGISFQAQELAAFSQSIQWFGSKALTRKAVSSVTFPDMGIHVPTSM